MKKLKAVQHVCIVSEHSEIDLMMIGYMTKKLLKFQFHNIPSDPHVYNTVELLPLWLF